MNSPSFRFATAPLFMLFCLVCGATKNELQVRKSILSRKLAGDVTIIR